MCGHSRHGGGGGGWWTRWPAWPCDSHHHVATLESTLNSGVDLLACCLCSSSSHKGNRAQRSAVVRGHNTAAAAAAAAAHDDGGRHILAPAGYRAPVSSLPTRRIPFSKPVVSSTSSIRPCSVPIEDDHAAGHPPAVRAWHVHLHPVARRQEDPHHLPAGHGDDRRLRRQHRPPQRSSHTTHLTSPLPIPPHFPSSLLQPNPTSLPPPLTPPSPLPLSVTQRVASVTKATWACRARGSSRWATPSRSASSTLPPPAHPSSILPPFPHHLHRSPPLLPPPSSPTVLQPLQRPHRRKLQQRQSPHPSPHTPFPCSTLPIPCGDLPSPLPAHVVCHALCLSPSSLSVPVTTPPPPSSSASATCRTRPQPTPSPSPLAPSRCALVTGSITR